LVPFGITCAFTQRVGVAATKIVRLKSDGGHREQQKEKKAMHVFDRVDPSTLDRRELHLWILAHTVILVLAVGVGLLMYPTVFTSPVNVTNLPSRPVFFGFCGLAALLVGYFVDRQVVIHHLRTEVQNKKRQITEIRREASIDLLTTLPGFNNFRDRLAMEFRRASNAHQMLSLLAVELKPSRVFADHEEIETAYGDAAKALIHRLRGEDSIYLFAPGILGIILPAVNARDAYALRDRMMDGLHDAAGASNRFSFGINVINFPDHVATAREMEESVRRLLKGKNSDLEMAVPVLGIQ
jgi:GGDEF domain-containing protein